MRQFLKKLVLTAFLAFPALAHAVTVDELLAKLDANLTYDTRESTMTMTVTKGDRVKTYKMHSYGRGSTEGVVEYLEGRDKGTKMYRKDQELWMYLPSVEKVQKISGHMLRQGMMGSDMSYEDMMEASSWKDRYTGTVEGEETFNGSKVWKVKLTAKSAEVSYPTRVVLVDQTTFIPVRQELYAASGMLLKTWEMSDVRVIEGKQVPMHMVVEDKLQAGSHTELQFETIDFSVAVPEEIFSVRWLERN